MPKPVDGLAGFVDATPAEIQRAHDVLHAILAGEVRLDLQPSSLMCLHSAHDVLSWVLGFPCGASFRMILNVAVGEMKAMGYHGCQSPPQA